MASPSVSPSIGDDKSIHTASPEQISAVDYDPSMDLKERYHKCVDDTLLRSKDAGEPQPPTNSGLQQASEDMFSVDYQEAPPMTNKTNQDFDMFSDE
jgi:hypothetical protein